MGFSLWYLAVNFERTVLFRRADPQGRAAFAGAPFLEFPRDRAYKSELQKTPGTGPARALNVTQRAPGSSSSCQRAGAIRASRAQWDRGIRNAPALRGGANTAPLSLAPLEEAKFIKFPHEGHHPGPPSALCVPNKSSCSVRGYLCLRAQRGVACSQRQVSSQHLDFPVSRCKTVRIHPPVEDAHSPMF